MRKARKVKVRKNIRYFYMVVSLLVFVFSFCKVMALFSDNKIENKSIEIYSYTNKFNYNYNVNLIENKYIDETTLTGKTAYVTDLIDNIDLNLNYQYSGKKVSNVQYTYEITGNLGAVYTNDGVEQKILEKTYNLVDPKTEKSADGNIDLKQNLKLNLKEQNNLVKDFEQKMNMSVDASYTVILKITTKTTIDGENVENKYQSQVVIGIADKTTDIVGDNNKEDTEYVNSTTEKNIDTSPIQLIIYVTLGIISVLIFKYVLDKTESTTKIKNEYRQELNRILKVCKEKIVQVRSKPDVNNANLIEVKDFSEIIKLSEELFKPILYWENKEADESWFIIMSNNFIYRFILKK